MHSKQIQTVFALSGPERYEYFVRKIADFEAVWSLKFDGWVLVGGDHGEPFVPFWPEKEFAAACAQGEFAGTKPESISLDQFREKWLPGMARDGRQLAIFPTPDGQAPVVYAEQLSQDLEAELEQYE